MDNTRAFAPSRTGSLHSSSGDNYTITINGVPVPYPLNMNFYRHRGEEDYSPSESRSPASSGSPWVSGNGDDFSGQPFDSPSNDDLTQYFRRAILEPESMPPDQNPSNPSSIAMSVQNVLPGHTPFLSSFLQDTQSGFPDIGSRSDYFMDPANMGSQIPIEYTLDSPSSVHVSSESIDGQPNVCPQTAPLSHDFPTTVRGSRTRSDPSPWPERPFMIANPQDPYPDVFLPDSPASPPAPLLPWDRILDGYNLGGVPASGFLSLGPGHHVSGDSLLSPPKPTHCRRKSDGDAVSQGPSYVANVMGHLHLSPTHDAFAGGPPMSPQTMSPQSLPVSHPAIDDTWEGPSSLQSVFSASLSPSSPGGFEDESQSQTLSEWLDFSGAEEPSSSSRVIKRNVTTRAVRMASNARMRSHARFPCHLCQQSLTTKGGLRNHVNSHLGVKRFKCSQLNCRKAFTTKWVCTRHERTVHGLMV